MRQRSWCAAQLAKQKIAASDGADMNQSDHVQIADKDGGEADRLDEAICPTDMNLICDDDLALIFEVMPKTVKFTMIADCCHSGSLLDQPEQQISGDKDPNAPAAPAGVDEMDAGSLMNDFFKGLKVRPLAICLHAHHQLFGSVASTTNSAMRLPLPTHPCRNSLEHLAHLQHFVRASRSRACSLRRTRLQSVG
jgi:Caspase domain